MNVHKLYFVYCDLFLVSLRHIRPFSSSSLHIHSVPFHRPWCLKKRTELETCFYPICMIATSSLMSFLTLTASFSVAVLEAFFEKEMATTTTVITFIILMLFDTRTRTSIFLTLKKLIAQLLCTVNDKPHHFLIKES